MNPGQIRQLENLAVRIKESLVRVPQTLGKDRASFRRQLNRLKRAADQAKPDQKTVKALAGLEKKIEASVKKKNHRRHNAPNLNFNRALPIYACKDEIICALTRHRVIIISGATGSGKTTQIPQFCLAAGKGIDGLIGCTQPRRIAAITVARRIADEMGETLGRTVGYKIRFADRTSENGYIKVMTDGMLLAETQRDPGLHAYETIIVDEAHERSLNIDFILGLLQTLLAKRNDLTVIITSATIDTRKFSSAFGNAPVIEVPGRLFPVKVRYLDSQERSGEDEDLSYIEMAVEAVAKIQRLSPLGDILIFMPTEQDIRETCELIEGRKYPNVTIMPLYARLSAAGQSRVFADMSNRKIIVATNIAETSLTIPKIKYVIDSGLARISRYLPQSRITALPVVPISQSSADQRKGRCGRVSDGVCIRLYTEDDYQARPLFTPPEMMRANLAEVILKMIDLKLGDISRFPFIDRPSAKQIKDGFNVLEELGAIDRNPLNIRSNRRPFVLTPNGCKMAKMPTDPRLSRILIEAQKEGCLEDVVVIVAALSIQDLQERPTEKAVEADNKHAQFNDPLSDFVSLLNIWQRYHHELKAAVNQSRIKKFCRQNFLSYKRMREWRDIHAQLMAVMSELDPPVQKANAGQDLPRSSFGSLAPIAVSHAKRPKFGLDNPLYAAIHKSILSGFLSNIALKKEKNIFRAAKDREVMIFPGSALFNRAGQWIVAAEMVETSRLFARKVAVVDHRWLEALGGNRCRYTYFEPHWERKRGEVIAYEQVSLFGLIIVSRRPVAFGRIDPEKACQVFITSALIQGDMKKKWPFMEYNHDLINGVRVLENKVRRKDILVGEEDLFRFYQKKLPQVYDIRTLEKEIKKNGTDAFLRMKASDLFRYVPDEKELNAFPDCIDLGGAKFACSYQFDPGKQNDGVTVKIPAASASTVLKSSLDWLVPGLYREKITLLIKALPKPYRKRLVPVADTVDMIMAQMPKSDDGLITALTDFIKRHFDLAIPAAAWSQQMLPDHLKMRIAITGSNNRTLCSGRDASILDGDFSPHIRPESRDEFEIFKKSREKTGLKPWDFDDFPASVTFTGNSGFRCTAYYGLEAAENTVNLRLFRQADTADRSHRAGVMALFAIHFASDLKFLKKRLKLHKDVHPAAAYFGGAKALEKRIYKKICHLLFNKNIRSRAQFYAHAQTVAPAIHYRGDELVENIASVLQTYHKTRIALHEMETAFGNSLLIKEFFRKLGAELQDLVPWTFVELYDEKQLGQIVRYVTAIEIRGRRAIVDFEKDRLKNRDLTPFQNKLKVLLEEMTASATPMSEAKRRAVEAYFWLIEEYKVSLFAQELKTALPVSKKRLKQKLIEIGKMV
jgi:ATP-dependent helicase HrpA